jgi:transcription elongation factor Elf1
MSTKQKSRFQCMNCGHLHWIEDQPEIDENELYIEIRCKKCKQVVNHLWVGNVPEDLYLYYDVTKDSKYY